VCDGLGDVLGDAVGLTDALGDVVAWVVGLGDAAGDGGGFGGFVVGRPRRLWRWCLRRLP
jgi:hypothetical protein